MRAGAEKCTITNVAVLDTTNPYSFALSTSTGVSSHASVHEGVLVPSECDKVGKHVWRHARATVAEHALAHWRASQTTPADLSTSPLCAIMRTDHLSRAVHERLTGLGVSLNATTALLGELDFMLHLGVRHHQLPHVAPRRPDKVVAAPLAREHRV